MEPQNYNHEKYDNKHLLVSESDDKLESFNISENKDNIK